MASHLFADLEVEDPQEWEAFLAQAAIRSTRGRRWAWLAVALTAALIAGVFAFLIVGAATGSPARLGPAPGSAGAQIPGQPPPGSTPLDE